MIEDFRLKVFEAVVQTGSFTKAALLLDVSQPAVSQNIAELEKATGYSLFERSYGKVGLTPEGLVFKSYADKILMWYRAAGETFNRDQTTPNIIRIGVADDLSAHIASDLVRSLSAMSGGIHFEVGTLSEENDLNIIPNPDAVSSMITVHPEIVCQAAAISTLGQVTSIQSLVETGADIAVWTPYHDTLPLELQSSVCLKSASSAVLKTSILSNPNLICFLPSVFVKDEIANRSMVMVNIPFKPKDMNMDIIPSSEFKQSNLWRLLTASFE